MRLPAPLVKTWNDIQLNFDALASGKVPHVMVYRAGAQSIASGSFTTAEECQFDSLLESTVNGMFTPTSTTVTIPQRGLYVITAHAQFIGGGGNRRIVAVHVNGVEPGVGSFRAEGFPAASAQPATALTKLLARGDQVTVRLFQDSGAAMNVQASGLSVTYVGGG